MSDLPPPRSHGAVPARILVAAVSAAAVALAAMAALPRREPRPSWIPIVPAYFYPSGSRDAAWEAIAAAAGDVPVRVILNPASGPGATADLRHASACRRARAAGVRILGYVHTSYGARDPGLVRADVEGYTRLYEVDGFFVDEMSNDPRSVPYYAELRGFIKGLNPAFEIVGNPGTLTDEAYRTTPTADVLVLFEGTAASFRDFGPPAWALRYPPGGFAAIVHGAGAAGDMRRAFDHASRAHLGGLYVTDGDGANPYDHLPPYWAGEVARMKRPR
ncbi:Spherulation-specific family 4 [Aquisphaera giovannonii]|uniref:Spherulation-specific family 4 n=1 Tax=Aquisphaera giovannonii TaxID=406548 RepID=A0A5B9VWK0_9BACT|nr:spherulation-specific family 4 protein [Aquisphaera giovannonii]QEH32241.1 Spherulation-specific family 4 [Aquisphaera giovannonii]